MCNVNCLKDKNKEKEAGNGQMFLSREQLFVLADLVCLNHRGSIN